MTKIEYYSVLNIQDLCYDMYNNASVYRKAMRSVLNTLVEEFNSKYKGTQVLIKIDNGVYKTVIKYYTISYINCAFKTDIGWRRYFDETTMIVGNKND
ncbi:hypothetical protein RaK2_00366 [Klebsiella phage vB_KleM_RaK2]|uniref:Uncharacterized protein n=1 Tax=Klebsiella phage vB_KleM_RaK2 TaxID=1147094 RepID=H6X4H3_9CAUD|nr:hypothetical protein F403_gp169 [Klebsiella phage vB_KleM_RaK2]AFA44639.1 hypothetical protein RaK2_00366 [Klebsiella phage vB_KleM_RaK2]